MGKSFQLNPLTGNLDLISEVSIGTANGLSVTADQALSLAAADTSTTGALTSTDWNAFNNKANSALNNLTTTAINADLLPAPSSTYSLGSTTAAWANIYGDIIVSNSELHVNRILRFYDYTNTFVGGIWDIADGTAGLVDSAIHTSLNFGHRTLVRTDGTTTALDWSVPGTLNASGSVVSNLGTPTNPDDAAPKTYVDSAILGVTSLYGAANGIATLDGSGLIPITQIPPSAIERLVIVANQAARFALTTATVQNGDTVKQTDTGEMWYVYDQTQLSSNAGYRVYTAGTASSVPYSGVTGVPTASGSTTGVLTSTDWTTFNNKVSSVAATVPGFLSISGSPITSSGTLAISYSGTALPVANGGTNSTTALNNNRVMVSSGGAIVETAAITANRALASNASGLPVASATTDTELGYVSGVTSAIQTQLNAKQNILQAVTTQTGTTYSATTTDNVILANPSATQTITLYTAVGNTGRTVTIKNISSQIVIIATTSAQTIDGASQRTLTTQYDGVTLVSDGSNWYII